MEYTVRDLSRLSGVTPRTLRHYDAIGLLKPARVASTGYRIYGEAEAARLRQILFYREFELDLKDIAAILDDPGFDEQTALLAHREALTQKRRRLDLLIRNVEKSLAAKQGGINMTDREKFEGFRETLIAENEANYGDEIREKYGDDAVDRSNAKLRGMSEEEYRSLEALAAEILETLARAAAEGDPASPLAQSLCEMHRRWISAHWDAYSPEAHMGLGEMYVADPRFAAYYDGAVPGGAAFLRDALKVYTNSR